VAKFKAGDKVKKIDGTGFSNGQKVLTVDHTEDRDGTNWVWLIETDTRTYESHLELAEPRTGLNIVDNRVDPPPQEIEAGDILIGEVSGDHYLVVDGTDKVLNLKDLKVYARHLIGLKPTGIRRENITITFN
jgi:hypothetical protein